MHIDTIIAGGGIIGLTLMRELYLKDPHREMALFEEGPFFGDHSSARNSGVLHAGLYYPAGSLKKRLCLEGNLLWRDLASELGISINECGKFVVASSEDEVDALEKLYERAVKNGVKGLSWSNDNSIGGFINVKKAFFSQTTAVIDLSAAIKNLFNWLYAKDLPLLKNNPIKNLFHDGKKFFVKTAREEITCSHFFNCAGGHAVELRKMLGLSDIENYWVKGNYLRLQGEYYNRSLIYPLPPKDLQGLGVHSSFDMDGVVRFGPNTQEVESYQYSMDQDIVEQMYPAIDKIFKNVEKTRLISDYCGIRSKIKKDGEIYPDFWIESGPIPGYHEALGIESPGFTAAPAIARYLSSRD